MSRSSTASRPLVVSGIVAAAALAFSLGAIAGSGEDAEPEAAAGAATVGPVAPTSDVPHPSIGDPDAPVVITEFSDFQCPFCHTFATTVEPELIATYVEAGLVRIEWHDYPARGEASIDAGVAARAADRQDAFWAYHDVLFDRQSELRFTREELVGIAAELGLDVGRFERDLDDPALEAAVLEDLAAAQRLGVRGTPSFLVGEQPIVGAQSLSVFADAIDAQLPPGSRP